jgi:hypothetical protein
MFKRGWGERIKKIKHEQDFSQTKNMDIDYGKLASICLVGTPKSGKSFFLKWLFYTVLHRFFDKVIVISPNAEFEYKWVDKNSRFTSWNGITLSFLDGVINKNEELRLRGQPLPCTAIINDDPIGHVDWHKDPWKRLVSRLSTSGRHLKLVPIYITQLMTMLNPAQRFNIEMIFMFNMHPKNMEHCMMITGEGGQGSKQNFIDLCASVCRDYGCIRYDLESKKIYKTRARPIPDFVLRAKGAEEQEETEGQNRIDNKRKR